MLLAIKSVFDAILSISVAMKFIKLKMLWLCIFWIIFYFVLQFVFKYYIEKSQSPETHGLLLIQSCINFVISIVLSLIQNFFFMKNSMLRSSTKLQLVVVVLLIYVFKSYPVRYTFFLYLATLTVWIIAEIVFGVKKEEDNLTILTNVLILMICIILLSFMQFKREMTMRKQYNRNKILDVEIEKTDELLSKLVPVHVLRGLKNDERIVEQVENVTLLFTDMVGFTAFSKSVKKP